MGLFKKKPKSIIVQRPAPAAKGRTDADAGKGDDETDPDATFKPALAAAAAGAATGPGGVTSAPPKPELGLKPPAPQLPPLPPKPSKKQNKKARVEPADFLALRSELMHVRARLDESEQARALVEARLAALDATTTAIASAKNDISEVASMVIQLQQEMSSRPVTGETPITGETQDELAAKVDALHNRLYGLQDHGPKIAEFEAQLALLRAELEAQHAQQANASTTGIAGNLETIEQLAAMQRQIDDLDDVRGRLGEIDSLHQRLGQVEHLGQRMEQLDHVDQRLALVDGLSAQLQQLNARVAAQAELGGQMAALRDRVSQLADRPAEAPVPDTSATDELRAQVSQLAERISVNDNEARAVREHMAMLDQRLTSVSTELANQLSELGRDIDGLGQRIPEVVDGVVSDEVVEALRGGQVKLANEQARYEIAFRQDLAALAEQLRRGS